MDPSEEKTNALLFVGWDTEKVARSSLIPSFISHSHFEKNILRSTEALKAELREDYSERYSRIVVLCFDAISAQQANELLEIGRVHFELFALLCDRPLLEAEESGNKVYMDILTNPHSESGPFDWRGYYLVAPSQDWASRPNARGFVETYVGMSQPSINFLEAWREEGPFVVCGKLEPTAPQM